MLRLIPIRLALLAGFVLAAVNVAQDANSASVADDAARERAIEIVLASLVVDEFDAERFELRLDDIATLGLPALFEILGSRGIPAAWNSERGGFVALDALRLASISGSIERLPLSRLRRFFQSVAENEPRPEFRALGAELIGKFGDSNDVHLLMRIARPLELNLQILPRAVRSSFEDALVSILRRDELGFVRVQDLFGEVHIGLEGAVIDAVGTVPSELALETLARIVGRRPGLDAHTLTAIARIGSQVVHPVDSLITGVVRSQVIHADGSTLLTAIRASGQLEDFEAIPLLIDRLTDTDEGIGACAHRALRELTRLRFRHDALLWRRWYERERYWWDELQPGLTIDLTRGDESAAVKAVMSMAGRRVDRHRLAGLLREALRRDEDSIVSLTCHALGQLASPVAVPALIDALEHGSKTVRDAAWSALRRITGLTLPPDAALWRATA